MIPVRIELNNFFSHKNTEIDFSKFDSALLIGNTEGDYDISNGCGKSAIFESVLWCLFNKARVAAMDDIIQWDEESCCVVMEFIQSGIRYKVKRLRSRVTGTSQVDFKYLSDDGEWIDISGSTAKLTNEKINSILKFDYKTFINSAYFRQNDISEFAESDPGRKKEILKSIIDISKWDEYEKESKSRLKNLKSEASIYQAKVEDLDVDEVSLAKANNKIEEIKSNLKLLRQEKYEVSDSLEKLISKYQEIKSNLDTDQWDKITLENKEIDTKMSSLRDKNETEKIELSKINKNLKSNNKDISDIVEKISKIEVEDDIEEKLKKVRDSLVIYRTKLSTATNLIEVLDKKEFKEGTCQICEQDISEELYSHLLNSHERERAGYEKDIIFSKNKIEECNSLIKKLQSSQKDAKLLDTLSSKLKSLRNEEAFISKSHNSVSEKIKELKNDFQKLKSKKELNMSILDSLKNDNFQKMNSKIEELRNSKKSLDEKISNKNREIGVLSQQIKTLKENIDSMRSDKETLIKLNKKLAAYEKISKLLGKNGIQTILLNAVIEDLEKTANKILVNICNEPLNILLETQRVGSDGVSIVDTLDLKVKKDGIVQNFKSLSGGEQFRISLSLRIAMSEISSRHGGSSLEFLLLDEINSPLDRHGTENLFVNVIRALEKKYKIMVITHNDSLKEKFSNVIDITKINGESTALFIQK